jgi:hypothetical protein
MRRRRALRLAHDGKTGRRRPVAAITAPAMGPFPHRGTGKSRVATTL